MGLFLAEPANNMLAAFAGLQRAQAAAVQRAEYLGLLKRFDWQFEFSDDYSFVQRGRQQLMRIRSLQPYVDADRALFNAARPDTHGAAVL